MYAKSFFDFQKLFGIYIKLKLVSDFLFETFLFTEQKGSKRTKTKGQVKIRSSSELYIKHEELLNSKKTEARKTKFSRTVKMSVI